MGPQEVKVQIYAVVLGSKTAGILLKEKINVYLSSYFTIYFFLSCFSEKDYYSFPTTSRSPSLISKFSFWFHLMISLMVTLYILATRYIDSPAETM